MIKTINEEAIRHMANLEEETCVIAGSLDTEAFYRRVERQRATCQRTASAFNGSEPVPEDGTAGAATTESATPPSWLATDPSLVEETKYR